LRPSLAAAAIAAVALTLPASAPAHVTKPANGFRVTMGWGNEPPLAGFENFVEVGVTDASGAPVRDLGSTAGVEVSFGGAQTVLPLVPSEVPGEFRAALVPTRPGTYAFHVTATANGEEIATGATCSDRTFDCVAAASEVAFPVKDPSIGELSERLARELPRVEQAADTAASARRIAIAAVVLAGLALAAALVFLVRGRRQSE
jgi:hypothetical protein